MSFNKSRSVFTCEPNCPRRRPGCQDHCEKHQRERAEHLRLKAIARRNRDVDCYISDNKAKKFNARVKSKKVSLGTIGPSEAKNERKTS